MFYFNLKTSLFPFRHNTLTYNAYNDTNDIHKKNEFPTLIPNHNSHTRNALLMRHNWTGDKLSPRHKSALAFYASFQNFHDLTQSTLSVPTPSPTKNFLLNTKLPQPRAKVEKAGEASPAPLASLWFIPTRLSRLALRLPHNTGTRGVGLAPLTHILGSGGPGPMTRLAVRTHKCGVVRADRTGVIASSCWRCDLFACVLCNWLNVEIIRGLRLDWGAGGLCEGEGLGLLTRWAFEVGRTWSWGGFLGSVCLVLFLGFWFEIILLEM